MNICDVVSVGRTFLPVMTSGPSFALVVCEVTGDGVENMIVEAVQSPLTETLEVAMPFDTSSSSRSRSFVFSVKALLNFRSLKGRLKLLRISVCQLVRIALFSKFYCDLNQLLKNTNGKTVLF